MNPPRPGYKQKRLVIRKWLLNLRYIDVQDSSTIATDDEKAIERAEGNRRNSEEVRRGNRFPVITEKGKPALGPVRISRSLLHPAGDGSLGKFKTVHAEFPLDPRRSTGGVLNDHTEDQFLNLLRRLSSPDGPRGTVQANHTLEPQASVRRRNVRRSLSARSYFFSQISTRRFLSLPSGVSFDATGSCEPKPTTAKALRPRC
jgi:hypothetical protein